MQTLPAAADTAATPCLSDSLLMRLPLMLLISVELWGLLIQTARLLFF
jgi:hypothetical protein